MGWLAGPGFEPGRRDLPKCLVHCVFGCFVQPADVQTPPLCVVPQVQGQGELPGV